MKSCRTLVQNGMIFLIVFVHSYSANASLYDAINSLLSLVNEIHMKQLQLNQQGASIFSEPELSNSIARLRIYHASLLARQQPNEISSRDIFMQKIKKLTFRCMPRESGQGVVQALSGLMSIGEEPVHLPDHKRVRLFSIPQNDIFCTIDKLRNEEICETAKELLSKMYESLENDQVFLTTCTNFELERVQKETFELIQEALH